MREPLEREELLDKGYIELLDLMPHPLTGVRPDNTVVNAARISYLGDSKGDEADKKLLFYLMRHKHWTPFEHVQLQLRIKCPLFVARQWFRHRTWCLSGDTEITFNRPDRWKQGTHCVQSPYSDGGFTIASLYRKFHNPVSNKQISNMLIRVFDELEGNFTISNINNIIYSGKKKVYRVTLGSGESIKASKNHKFLSKECWVKLKDLNIGDYLMTCQNEFSKTQNFTIDINKDKEIWKPILGFEGRYEVSNFGRVRSLINTRNRRLETPKIKKITINSKGRCVVSLSNNGKSKVYPVSHLVYEAFIENRDKYESILHKNDNALDNRPCNLYKGNQKDNSRDMVKNGGGSYLGATPSKIISIEYAGIEDTYDIEVTGPNHNFLGNNIITHNSYNELSRRYTDRGMDFYIPDKWRGQDEANKQSSSGDVKYHNAIKAAYKYHVEHTEQIYRDLISSNVAKEMARMVLPQSMYTEFYGTVDLRNLLHFISLRNEEHAQYEIQVYGKVLLDWVDKYAPWTGEAFKKYVLKENK